jgi:hypothetical protein
MKFPTWLPRLAPACLASTLLACDPAFSLGARQYLPVPRPENEGDSVTGRPLFDPRPPADCMETALGRIEGVSEVRRWPSKKGSRVRGEGMSFAVSGYPWSDRSYGNVRVTAHDRERPVVDVSYSWIGTGSSVLPAQQRYLVNQATAVLGQLREACLPMAVDDMQCVVEGARADRSTACST